jgi:hypothetical protein
VFCNTFCPRVSGELIGFSRHECTVEFYQACCAGVFLTVVARSPGTDETRPKRKTVVGTFGEKVVWMIEAWKAQGWDQAVGTPAQDKGQG